MSCLAEFIPLSLSFSLSLKQSEGPQQKKGACNISVYLLVLNVKLYLNFVDEPVDVSAV